MFKTIAAGIAGVALAAVATLSLAADITGAGATFPKPIYLKWADTYKAHRQQRELPGHRLGRPASSRSKPAPSTSALPTSR